MPKSDALMTVRLSKNQAGGQGVGSSARAALEGASCWKYDEKETRAPQKGSSRGAGVGKDKALESAEEEALEPEYGDEIARERAERHKHTRHWQASKSHLLMTPLRGGILPSAKTRLSRQVNCLGPAGPRGTIPNEQA